VRSKEMRREDKCVIEKLGKTCLYLYKENVIT